MPDGMTPPRHPNFFLHLSNRLEELAGQLADNLCISVNDPMSLRTVVVPSAGTSRWLSMQLADRQGLAMGIRYPFLRRTIDELTSGMLGGQRRYSPLFSREPMAWWFFDHFPDFVPLETFAPVRNYLRDGAPLRRFELARRIADLFDQYQVYRPQMLRRWEISEHEGGWQGVLWRALRRDLPGQESFVDLYHALIDHDDSSIDADLLPDSLAIFGLNTIPPTFLDVLRKASGYIRIDVYLLTPTDEYWSDLLSEKQQLKANAETDGLCGNPLGNSLGKLGRDVLDQLLNRDAQQQSEKFSFSLPHTLLGRVQDDLRVLRDRTSTEVKEAISNEDASIQVHACHGPMREVEVLHDYLLSLFQDEPSLRTRDVIVMAPNIETYAPYISAVFGVPESESSQIPYSLADRSARSGFGTVDAFLKLLEVGSSRFEVTQVVGVLETEVFRCCFKLYAVDLDRIRTWIRDCGTVWGIDSEHRARLGFDQTDDFSWAKLEATLLDGYAMNGRDSKLRNGVLPYSDLEGDHLETLSKFLLAFDVLRKTAQILRTPRMRPAWAEALRGLLKQLRADDLLPAAEVHSIRNILSELTASHPASSSEPVTADVITAYLDFRLRETQVTGGFLDGRVTFCSLRPMRAIPARVIALLGMNDTDFPRQATRPTFDLIAMEPAKGDRSLRDDDRYLFLEALLSTRQYLFISHIGQSYRDLRKSPPSSVVTELLDYLNQGFSLPESVSKRLHVQHPLQAFSASYFENESPKSFSQANAEAAQILAQGKLKRRELFTVPLAEPDGVWRRVTPERLRDFFSNPARWLCEWRLGIRLEREQKGLSTKEPLGLDPLESYQLRQDLVEAALRRDDRPVWEAARARGRLPIGPFGDINRIVIEQTVERFVESVRAQIGGHKREHAHVRWDHVPWKIDGRIDGLYDGQLLRMRCAALKAKDLVTVWVEHVLLNLVAPGTTTRIIDREGDLRLFRAPASAETTTTIANHLLDLYWAGLSSPLHFFPHASLAYAKSALSDKQRDDWSPAALHAAMRAWDPDEPWVSLIHVDCLPIDDDFRETALRFFEPMITHLEGNLP